MFKKIITFNGDHSGFFSIDFKNRTVSLGLAVVVTIVCIVLMEIFIF